MLNDYYFKIVRAGKGYNYCIKFYINGECICGEGFARTKLACLFQAWIFEIKERRNHVTK